MDQSIRYDRQLRLWASSGQSNLERSHICVTSGNTLSCEILKNLVLPGIGEFSIIDSTMVTHQCLSSNFILDNSDLGKPRASAAVNGLLSLNSNVKGYPVVEPLDDLVTGDASFWDRFSAIVITEYHPQTKRLLDILWSRQIPVVLAYTRGLYGSLKVHVNETTVIDTHRQSRIFDLRILSPWPELRAHVDSIDLQAINDLQHSHVPYVILLIKAMDVWKDHHDKAPGSLEEKKKFKSIVESMARLPEEQNFSEALSGLFRAHQHVEVPTYLQALFRDPRAIVTRSSSIFWIYIQALSRFCGSHGCIPLQGVLPDMTADTQSYVTLQNLYRGKALRDKDEFTEHVIAVFHGIGIEPAIDDALIDIFCKNTMSLFVSTGSSKPFSKKMIHDLKDVNGDSHISLAVYFAMIAFHTFHDKSGRFPDSSEMKDFAEVFLEICDISPGSILDATRKVLEEILLHQTTDYHNACSFMGGLASQEVLKIVTAQYEPLDNVLVYDGIRLVTARWKTG